MTDFDVIIVGSGMSGGWVAKELAERGLKVAVIERGRNIDPVEDYKDWTDPWDTESLDRKTPDDLKKYPIQSSVYAFNQNTKHFWVDDNENPYEVPEGQNFAWRRGYHKGGKSLMWARQSYRLSEIDFNANKKDGIAVDWPVRYKDIAPWYDKVERFAGISGSKEGIEILPDGVFQPPHELTVAELLFKNKVETSFPGRHVIPGRAAHLTEPTQEQLDLGRGKCQNRSLCERGCSFGAYFSSVAATLPAAERTGNLTMITDRMVQKLDYDPKSKKISGVKTINTKTKAGETYTAKVVFLNAGTIPTTMILQNSATEEFKTGLANSSGQLGRNLMDHLFGSRGGGIIPGMLDRYHSGRRPNGFYIPRFRNNTEEGQDFIRGFGYQGNAMRSNWRGKINGAGIGQSFKQEASVPGNWWVSLVCAGEMLPDYRNNVQLHASRKDAWGMPIPIIDTKLRENELKLMQQAARDTKAMLEAVGAQNIKAQTPEEAETIAVGDGIHEMGTARMGRDPKTSVLNGFNQSWDIPNLFISDGSFMTSSGCQNPSLTYMAFSARAAHHAADLLERGEL
jgi:choline dehydrogenase-like flavoprotein